MKAPNPNPNPNANANANPNPNPNPNPNLAQLSEQECEEEEEEEGRRGKAEERELRGVRLRQGGLLEASAVVAAMGPWTCKLEDWAGVPVPLEGVWSTSLVYEGVTEPQP